MPFTIDDLERAPFLVEHDDKKHITRLLFPHAAQHGLPDGSDSDQTVFFHGLALNTRYVSDTSPIYVRKSDQAIVITGSSTVYNSTGTRLTVVLPSSPTLGELHIIKYGGGNGAWIMPHIITADSATIDGLSSLDVSDNYGAVGLLWTGPEWGKIFLTAASGTSGSGGGGGGGGAPINSAYVTIGNDSTLTAERALTAGTGIRVVDGGANSTVTILINNNVVATITGSQFTGPVIAAGGLSGSLQTLSSGQAYLAPGPGISIITGSSGQITIGRKLHFLPILAGIQNTSFLTTSKQSVGAVYFDPAQGHANGKIFFRGILETTNASFLAYLDLYDVNGIVQWPPGVIQASIISCSSLVATHIEANITSILSTVTGAGLIEARLWMDPSGSTQQVTCKGASIQVQFP